MAQEFLTISVATVFRKCLFQYKLTQILSNLPRMARCSYCNSMILFGGKRDGKLVFCNDNCQHEGVYVTLANQLPDDLVADAVDAVHSGECPRCGGAGPIDVHSSHTIWSAVYLTSWRSRPEIQCRSCGRKRQIMGLLSSMTLGWWGFPWGTIMTPVQIFRNLRGMFGGPSSDAPSEQLETLVRLDLATRMKAGKSLFTTPRPLKSNKAKSKPIADDSKLDDLDEVDDEVDQFDDLEVIEEKPKPPFNVICSECNANLKAPASLAGKQVKCPKCGSAMRVPKN